MPGRTRLCAAARLSCNPDHLAVRTRSQIVKRTYATTRCTNVEYGARCAARVRQRVKLSLEIARELRLNERNETAVAAAARLGCSDSLVYKIRQGHIWREAAVNSSVFHQAA